MSNNSTFGKINQWARNSISLKLLVIGLFVLVLLIPSEMVQSLIRERETTRNEAISEIWRTWGDRQVLAGPVVSVPVVTVKSLPNGTVESTTRFLHFLPENLSVSQVLCEGYQNTRHILFNFKKSNIDRSAYEVSTISTNFVQADTSARSAYC